MKREFDFLDMMPAMTSRVPESLGPLTIDLEEPFRYPIKSTGDFRKGVVTVGAWVMGRRSGEIDGKMKNVYNPEFIVVYNIPEFNERGYSIVEGNEIWAPNPRRKDDVKEPLEFEFVITAPLEVESIRTWMTPLAIKAFIDGKTPNPLEVYKRVENYYRTYVDFAPDPRRYNLMSLAVIASHFYRLFSAFPRIHIRGPHESGKERASRCFAYLAFLGIFEVNPTEAAMFRLAECQVTQAIDEAERFYQTGPGAGEVAPQRALINTGYQEGARVPRVLDDFGKMKSIKWYDAYAPMALASIRDLGRVTRSRFIDVLMRRTIVPDFSNRAPSEKSAEEIRDELYMLRLLYAGKVAEMRDKLTNKEFGILNRTWELYRPLLVVARALGLPHDDLVSFIKEWEGRRRGDEMTEDDVVMLGVLNEMAEKGEDDPMLVTNANVVDALIEEGTDQKERKYLSQRVGYIMRGFGFSKMRPDPKKGMIYKIPKKEIKGLWDSYAPKDESGAITGFSKVMGKTKPPQTDPPIEHIIDPVPPHKPAKPCKSGAIERPKTEEPATVSDLKARLFEAFGVNPFKPSQLPDHFTGDELVKLSAIMDDMRERGELVVTSLESGQYAFQLVRK